MGVVLGGLADRLPWNPFLEKSSSLLASLLSSPSFWGAAVQDALPLVEEPVAWPTGGREREDTGLT